jgi:heme/copper-type cytochrome/quinol oxidase subunit 4
MLFSLLASNQRVKLNLSGVKNGLIYSYLFLTGSLLLASLFMPPGMKEGLIMYAIFPPAVGVLVLGMQWGGNTSQVFFFQLLSYSLSVVVIPIAAYLLLGGSVDATTLLIQLILAFILPGVLSFFMDMKDKKLMANLSSVFLAILFYIVIAKSQPWIVANWAELVIYMIPLATLNAAVGYTAYKLTKSPDATLYSLLKNGGAAAAVSLNVFPPAAIAMISAKTLIDVGLILGFGQLWKNSRPVYID